MSERRKSMNKSRVQEKVRQLKSYVDTVELEVSRPNPNYMYIQSKVNVIPSLVEQLQKELKQ